MSGSPTEIIKEKLDIVEFLKGYLTVQPAGKNFKANCPFHKEKTPSFMISPDRQTWHCFGCALGGDIFAFVMRYENVEFGDALRILAEKAGVELKRMNPAEHRESGLLYDINIAAKEFFRNELEKNSVAQKYLKERGLVAETINEFELGWAPAETEALGMHLLRQGFRPEDIVRAGLVIRTERGVRLDRFRGRIMFPIHNHFGKVVAFTGRVLPQFDDGQSGKYVNSPESAVFAKSKLLYGFWKTKNFIREGQAAFIVEGQMDFLMSWQVGAKNVVASSGTALTEDHLRTLRRLTDKLVLSFDSDEAGLAAGERAIDLAEADDFNVRVAVFKGYKDPAEAALADPKYFEEAVEKAEPAPEFYFNRYLPKEAQNYGEREALRSLRIVLQKLRNIASPVLRGYWFKELSRRANLSETLLIEESERLPAAKNETKESENLSAGMPQAKYSRRDLISEHLLGSAFASGNFAGLKPHVKYFSPMFCRAFELLSSGSRKSEDPKLDDLLSSIAFRSAVISEAEFSNLCIQLEIEYLKEKRKLLTQEVREAETSGDESKVKSALQELSQLPTSFSSA